MLAEKLKKYNIVLASGSPRRQELLKGLGLVFKVQSLDVDESYPSGLSHADIAVYLSELKAEAFSVENAGKNSLVITADTIVWLNNEILPKPKDTAEAHSVLRKLSGKSHEVITGVTIRSRQRKHSFYSVTEVYFKELTEEEIAYYVDVYKPFDKAGAYGIQEWIGYTGIERINGSYYNVVGLPVQMLYKELLDFVNRS